MKKYIALTALCLSCKSFATGYVIRNPYDQSSVTTIVLISHGWGVLWEAGQQTLPLLVQSYPAPTRFFPSHIGIMIRGCVHYTEVLDYFSPSSWPITTWRKVE
ncbi:hypothetical protein [Endozoicomonas sp. 4G]|uniref:hypothetical protein n=1 Tax=Endozoicomonas sp. 4G TaxID=2872754 RepID=UPI0020784F0F|nr:hypothetical protein [Endozoicomonas sp. 4G]